MSIVIVESDYQIAIQAITSAVKVSSLIHNIVKDSIVLASAIRNIQFVYCDIYTNKVVELIARNAHHCAVIFLVILFVITKLDLNNLIDFSNIVNIIISIPSLA